jgi:hypothetical protein
VLLELDQTWYREAGRYGIGEIRVAMGDWKWYWEHRRKDLNTSAHDYGVPTAHLGPYGSATAG